MTYAHQFSGWAGQCDNVGSNKPEDLLNTLSPKLPYMWIYNLGRQDDDPVVPQTPGIKMIIVLGVMAFICYMIALTLPVHWVLNHPERKGQLPWWA